MNSLRQRLLYGIICGVALALGVGNATVFFAMRARLYNEMDEELAARASTLVSMISEEAGTLEFEWMEYDSSPPGFQPGLDYYLIEELETRQILAASPALAGWEMLDLAWSTNRFAPHDAVLPGYLPGRSVMRVFNARVDPPEDSEDEDLARDAAPKRRAATETSGTRIKLWVARVDTVEPTMAAMRRFLIALWCVCVVLVGLIIWRVVRSSLRPLDQLKDRIESLDEQASGERISIPRLPIELAPVVRELNHLLERVETTLKRERTLTSNVAHELRTPIAGILSIIEVTLARLRSPEEYRESTEECFEIAKRMHWLVLNLLSVARIEAKNIQLLNRPLDLKRALIEWWEPFSSRVSARRIQVHWDVPPTAGVETDPEYLRIVVSNLFDNAASYTPDGGSIRITVAPEGRISVANQTPDLKSETAKHVFDPFWRHSPSREDSDLHAGLGLSLCRRIMELLGGRISAEVQESKKMFEVRLEMA